MRRRSTNSVGVNVCTTSPCWFNVVTWTLTIPCPGRVAGTHRLQPAQLAADAEDPAGRPEIAGEAEAHRERGSMPAARRKPREHRMARGLVVEMKRLRVERRRESGDRIGVDGQRGRAEFLPNSEILEITHGHVAASFSRRALTALPAGRMVRMRSAATRQAAPAT